MFFPVHIDNPHNHEFKLTARDFPDEELVTESFVKALDDAPHWIELLLKRAVMQGLNVPIPSAPQQEETLVAVSAMVWLKVLLSNAQLAQGPASKDSKDFFIGYRADNLVEKLREIGYCYQISVVPLPPKTQR